jgi:thiamine pyrophosphokinase
MRALVVLGGDPLGSEGWLRGIPADVVIAADGGAASCAAAGRRPDLVVGDLDSLDEPALAAFAAGGTRVERHPAEKDQTDAELALEAAVRAGADEIVVVGAFGGPRLDHELANLLLLARPDLAAIDLAIVTERLTLRALRGPGILELGGSPGDWVSLVPLSETVAGVATDGLRYPLRHEPLARGSSRGVSNELTGVRASVEAGSGILLVTVTTRRR